MPFGMPLKMCLLRAITSVLEFMELFHQGLRLRAKNPTLVHADSSRSHLIVTVTLTTATSLASTGEFPFALGQFKYRKANCSPRNTLWG